MNAVEKMLLYTFKQSFISSVQDIEGKTNLPLLFRAKLDKVLAGKKDEAVEAKIAAAVEAAVAKAKAAPAPAAGLLNRVFG